MVAETKVKDLLIREGEVSDYEKRRVLIATWALEHVMSSLIKDYESVGIQIECECVVKRKDGAGMVVIEGTPLI